MSKKDISYLLIPCAFFVAAGLFLAIQFHSKSVGTRQDTWERISERARRGEITSDTLVERWRSSSDSFDQFQNKVWQNVRLMGWCILFGAALQIFVVFRVSSAVRNANKALHATAAPSGS